MLRALSDGAKFQELTEMLEASAANSRNGARPRCSSQYINAPVIKSKSRLVSE